MQVPIRKKETYIKPKPDPYLTEEKFAELKDRLEKWKTVSRPRLAEEVKRLAEMGDFSENVGYQVAKGKLRGLNQRIIELEEHINSAIIFSPSKDIEIVGLGHNVTVENDGKEKNYTILGGAETNPTAGIISHNSPIGSALIGHRVGETVTVDINGQTKKFEIKKIA
jgi:transcription elongation factor GreA